MSEIRDFDRAVEQAWRAFRGRLAERMAGMSGSERFTIGAYRPGRGMTLPPRIEVRLVRNRLVASVREKHGPNMGRLRWEACLAYLQDSWWDAPNPSARAVWQRRSWWLKTNPQYVDFLAVEIVRLLQEGFGVAHPSLLDVGDDIWNTTAPGPESDGAYGDLPPVPPAARRLAHPVRDHDHLMSVVLATLAPHFGHVPVRDSDGDIPVSRQHAVTFVRVLSHRPVVELCCWPVLDIRDLDAARIEVNILNRDNPVANVVLDEDRLLVRATVLAQPFVPKHLEDLLDGFTALMDEITPDLAARVQGRRWLDPSDDEEYASHEESG